VKARDLPEGVFLVCGVCRRLVSGGHQVLREDDTLAMALCGPCWTLLGLDLPEGLDEDDAASIFRVRLENNSGHLDQAIDREN
jgi:hypothetical protein